MALIENINTKKVVYLKSYHTLGRNPKKCDTCLIQKDISNIHASIRWEGSHWIIYDHSSKNGTYIIQKNIPRIKSIKLTPEMIIRFGGFPDACWKVIDLDPPVPCLVASADNRKIIKLESHNVFPDKDNPEVTIISPEPGRWRLEKDDTIEFLSNDEILEIGSDFWRCRNLFLEDSTIDNTGINPVTAISLSELQYTFKVSLDEENVTITILSDTEKFELGDKAHHYLLVTLARQKIKDGKCDWPSTEHGWISMDEITQMLDMNKEHINVQIHRAREQIKELASIDHPQFYYLDVIERKTGKIRLGISKIKIYSASGLEGTYGFDDSCKE